MADDLTIHVDPSKDFFIDMLTKDISLQECILDLVDNSVHSLVRTYNLDVVTDLFEGRRPKKSFAATVDIEVSPRKFSIEDTCGGISVKDAKDHVFLLGKAAPDPSHTGLGVFGIGMKRAIFKLGEIIKIESNTTTEDFVVDINVAKWRKQDGWNLEFTEVNKKKHATGGTKIAVTKLNDSASKYFALTTFESALKKRIATTYALFINAGLTIKVNGEKIEENLPEFAESESLKTVRKVAKKGDVDIMILAGLSPKKDTRPHGWYVFCNGRLILDADRTERTGWGAVHVPQFHPKYNHFLGMAFLRSKDVRDLPWTTTKEGVERESPVYQFALAEMRAASRPVIDFLNRLYPDVRVESESEREVHVQATNTGVEKVSGRANETFKATVPPKKEAEFIWIRYKKTQKQVDKVKKAIGKSNMSPSAIGEFTFDDYMKRNT